MSHLTTAGADEIRLSCRHIFTGGHRCGSPALRHADFCFYHQTARRPGPRQPQVSQSATPLRAAKLSTFDLPSPADLAERSGLALAIGQIMHKIAHNEIDPRRAGLLLYAIQIASGNLPKTPSNAATPALPQGALVDTLDPDPDLGPLAPEIEWEEPEPPQPSGNETLSRWVREMRYKTGRSSPEAEAAEEAAEQAAQQARVQAAVAAKHAAKRAATLVQTPQTTALTLQAVATPSNEYLVLSAAALGDHRLSRHGRFKYIPLPHRNSDLRAEGASQSSLGRNRDPRRACSLGWVSPGTSVPKESGLEARDKAYTLKTRARLWSVTEQDPRPNKATRPNAQRLPRLMGSEGDALRSIDLCLR